MERRALLRLMTVTGALFAAAPGCEDIDLERLTTFGVSAGPMDRATADEYDRLISQLWVSFSSTDHKATLTSLTQHHLQALVRNLRRPQDGETRQQLCASLASLLQLAGEIAFDANRYTDAAHNYTLACTAAKEAAAYDHWACAVTRHGFISLYERDFREALPILDAAKRIAARGDTALATRFWVQAVRAQSLAGLGDLSGCRRALDAAEDVLTLSGAPQPGGWLRFTGARLDEERGRCYVQLGRADLAEPVLQRALTAELTVRRRGSALVDLAEVGLLRGDVHQVVHYGGAAMDTARQSGSGVIRRRLAGLQSQLAPFRADSHIRHLDSQIASLSATPAL